nr:hypothetical protein [uncultured Allomuricauda sp.]
MNKLFITTTLVIFLGVNVSSQSITSDIYSWEGRVESPNIGTYNVNTLILNDNGTFKLLWYRFPSKKFSRIHALIGLKEEEGKYTIENGVIKLTSDSKKLDIEFSKINKNRIAPIVDGIKSENTWKKVH